MELAAQYDTIEGDLLEPAATLESGRPTRTSGQAADAHIALLNAIEAAERERAELAVPFDTPDAPHAIATDRWPALEKALLDDFGRTAPADLKGRLYAALLQHPGLVVRTTRETLADPHAEKNSWPTYTGWLTASTGRIDALRGIQHRAAAELGRDAPSDLDTARAREARDLSVSLAVLAAVTVLALTLRLSITRPLGEVSAGVRALSEGDLSYDTRYAGPDELGAVADTFRELRVTTGRLAGEINTMNTAIDDNRLGHRADVAAFEGTWAQLLGGMNGTMASFAAAQGRRDKAEQELASIFHLSLDLLCIAGLDGRFKRVNPAFERTLGHSAEALLGRAWLEFVHPEDRARVPSSTGWRAASPWPSPRTASCGPTAPNAGSSGAPARSPWTASSTPPHATSPRAAAPPANRPRCAASPPSSRAGCHPTRSSPRSPTRWARS
ncbi:nitrate- and nitrite sensing domain-containing protein [Streptomyces sp. NPDC001642]|uniref:nitrate- and nitrite sensing domain-containing protein n=1 Tax=Streptomyces sp. NPDC001642 TaxID=3154392 RepID=UPI0033324F01